VDLIKINFRANEEFRNQESGMRGRANKGYNIQVDRLIEKVHLGDQSINITIRGLKGRK
jgi:hypothetical protein